MTHTRQARGGSLACSEAWRFFPFPRKTKDAKQSDSAAGVEGAPGTPSVRRLAASPLRTQPFRACSLDGYSEVGLAVAAEREVGEGACGVEGPADPGARDDFAGDVGRPPIDRASFIVARGRHTPHRLQRPRPLG